MFEKERLKKWFCFGEEESHNEPLNQPDTIVACSYTAGSISDTLFTSEDIVMQLESGIASPASLHTLSSGTLDHDMAIEGNENNSQRVNGIDPREHAILVFSCYMSDGMEKRGQQWEMQQVTVPLEIPMQTLPVVFGAECKSTRRLNNRFMLDLKTEGRGVHMKASIQFHDERDLYANPTLSGPSRISTLRDLFTTLEITNADVAGSPLKVPIAVEVSLLNEYPNTKPTCTPRSGTYTRIGVRNLADENVSPDDHEPMTEGLFVKIDDIATTPLEELSCLWAPERYIHGLGMSSLGVLQRDFNFATVLQDHESKRALFSWIRSALSAKDYAAVEEMFTSGIAPVLRPMTFHNSNAGASAATIDSGPIYLAVRVVNHLHTLSLGHIPLPANVLMTLIGPAKGMLKAMDHALWEALFDHEASTELCEKDPNVEEKWNIRWWVLPQSRRLATNLSGGFWTGLGHLCKFERGNIKRFLDPERLEGGDRRLYVEAHLVSVEGHGKAGEVETPESSIDGRGRAEMEGDGVVEKVEGERVPLEELFEGLTPAADEEWSAECKGE